MKCPPCRARYGAEFKKIRAATIAEAYGGVCARCGLMMRSGQSLDLDHLDDGSLAYSHTGCNRAVGGANGARVTNAKKRGTPVAVPTFPAGSMHRPPSPRADTPPGTPEDYTLNSIGELYLDRHWWRWESGAWVSGTGCSRVW